jgi:acetolactate decarboxylase
MYKIILLISSFLTCISCTVNSQTHFNVAYKGALKEIMHGGDLSSRIDLRSLQKEPHLFALGSVEDLKGEILILDGKSMVSSVVQNKVSTDTTFQQKASLLVYATVKEWVEIPLPPSVSTKEELEAYLPKAAKDNGINPSKPFPFLIEGNQLSIDWHVIDWVKGDNEHSHEKHQRAGVSATATDADAVILGFYSDKHHRIWTHHDTNVHLHALLKTMFVAAHVDDVKLRPGSRLKLPRVM